MKLLLVGTVSKGTQDTRVLTEPSVLGFLRSLLGNGLTGSGRLGCSLSNLLPLRSAAILRLTTCYAQLGGLGFSQISLGSLPHPSSWSLSLVNSSQLLPHNSSAHS